MLNINLLGPLEVRDADRDITPTACKPRQLLALLALNGNRIVSVSDLADELWEGNLPRSWKTTLQTYILHLRKLIGNRAAAGTGRYERLSTRPGGYLFHLDEDALDVDRFAEIYRLGVDCAATGDHARAAKSLAAAVRLWRGAALADVELGPQLRVEVARLNELRIATIEAYCLAELRNGRHNQVLIDLAGHVARYPIHEPLHALYMRALYQANRRTQALQVYRDLDRTLRAELGLSPSIPLQRLHQAMLTEDSSLDEEDLRRWRSPA